ncbi:hypothetical protein ACHAXM_001989 [Skeletonema potamos]
MSGRRKISNRFSGFFGGGTPSCMSFKDEEALTKATSTKKESCSALSADKEDTRTSYIIYSTLTALIIISIIIGWTELFRMPKIINASAPPFVFSEKRARVHLNQIAERPHPFGSVDNERVANYIISYAESLQDMYGSDAIEVQIQNVTTDEYNYYEDYVDNPPYEKAQIVNVAILVKGFDHDDTNDENNKGSAIMISCHYDGVPHGPAASDDAISCATMLEMASVLSSSTAKLKRDVLLVFVDAEEVGLLGATMFFEVDAHPWSLLPSMAINLDNSAICGKEMFEKSNSRYGADAYLKYAAHPKAFSFSEWWYEINDEWNDAVVYERHRLHTLRLGCSSNSWAYHSIDDDTKHVSKGALQHMGENILAIVRGVATETNFPGRMPQEQGNTDEKDNSGSGLFYFTLIGGYAFSISSKTASIIFPIIAAALMMAIMPLTMFFTKTGDPSRTVKASLTIRWMYFLFAVLNFILGFGACIIAFAACCLWKRPTEYQLTSKANAGETANLAWNGLGYLPSILSCFALLCTTLFVYLCPRKRVLSESLSQERSENDKETQASSFKDEKEETSVVHNEKEEEEEDDESEITIDPCDVPDEINAIEMSESQEISMLGIYGAEGAPPPTEGIHVHDDITASAKDTSNSNSGVQHTRSDTLLCQFGRDVYVGVFYFYASLLFILSVAMKDGIILVLWQSIFMWLGAALEMFLSWCCCDRQRWLLLTRTFVSTVPALLFLSSAVYWVLSDFRYYPQTNLGKDFWIGSPAIDALCIGVVVPLFMPHLVMVPTKAYRALGIVSVLGLIVVASACIIVSISKPRFVF